jgi:hypothetical protein
MQRIHIKQWNITSLRGRVWRQLSGQSNMDYCSRAPACTINMLVHLKNIHVIAEILMAICIKFSVFQDLMLCNLADKCQCFRQTCCLCLQSSVSTFTTEDTYTLKIVAADFLKWRMPSSGMWRHVDLVWTDVSEERIASTFRVEKSEREKPAWAGGCGLQMEAIRSSETLVRTRSTQRHIPEDGILHSHRRENL